MIILTSTNKLTVTRSSAATVTVTADYVDTTSGTVTVGTPVQLNFSSAATSDVIAAPSSGTARNVVRVCVVNTSTTLANTVTLNVNTSATDYPAYRATLQPGWSLIVDEYGNSFIRNDSSASFAGVTQQMNVVAINADVINANGTANTIADVTGLQFPVTSGETSFFEFIIPYTAAATTTGSRWSINGPATSFLAYESEYSLTATTVTRNSGVVAYDNPATSNATSVATTGNIARIWGVITPSASGNVVARFASEVASSAITAKAGAFVRYMRVL